MFIAASSGFSTTRGSFVDLIKVFGGRTVEEFRYVRLPSTVLIMADGLQLSALAAAFGVLFGEWFGADQGLGVLLITSMQNYKIELLWLAALTATALSNAGMMLIGVATRYAARRFA
jgi:NitT/TauT family transport system permease protein